MSYHKEQKLNDWVEMLHSIYGLSQNYARSEYEMLAHLAEVTGAFSKYLFKLGQAEQAKVFLPKMFGWAVALLKKVKGDRANFEEILLTKYPTVCSYCASCPCQCAQGKKPAINNSLVSSIYHRKTPSQGRSINEFQMMFRRIYEPSWGFSQVTPGSAEAVGKLQKMYTRLVEELSEVGEAVRFSHLYPSNFDNELADYVAWLFGLVSCLQYAAPGSADMLLIADLFWPAYPGICTVCMLDVCDCRPSPARELQSKPSLSELEYKDGLTQTSNKARFDRNMTEIGNGALPFPSPIACIRIDVDDFKRFNESPFDHGVGDEALKHLANVLRQKVRTRDRIFRLGGDEFAILCPDLSASEAAGMMSRVARALKDKPVPAHGVSGATPPDITLSVGIAQSVDPLRIKEDFERADSAAIESKDGGKDRITIGNDVSIQRQVTQKPPMSDRVE
jgi:diguanylate cyclase (GGDEF)-like protein